MTNSIPLKVTTESVAEYKTHQPMWKAAAKLAAGPVWAEFGVCTGMSTRELQNYLPASGIFHLFDSLEGIPEPWVMGDGTTYRKGMWSSLGKWPTFTLDDSRFRHHEGWFADTLPFKFEQPLGLVHIDSDLYSSCKTVLTAIDPYLVNGTVVIFDELVDYAGRYPNWEQGEWRALQESGIEIDWKGRARWAMFGVVVNRRHGPKRAGADR